MLYEVVTGKLTIYGEGSTTTTNYLYFDKDGSFAEFYLENPPNYPLFNGSTGLVDNAWHLVTIVQRSTTDRELFVDGVSNGTVITSYSIHYTKLYEPADCAPEQYPCHDRGQRHLPRVPPD